ncbi:hypothetical protein L2E82_20076 [Cichorium intybus]|uniref:Uncharacterized protein n=1 Tax=Cichorium intybus TaxID=13427 RepID=A0ACB9DS35_CICIN|nr:hypothetical protein L2E82_20076 [Cichorium intybus]
MLIIMTYNHIISFAVFDKINDLILCFLRCLWSNLNWKFGAIVDANSHLKKIDTNDLSFFGFHSFLQYHYGRAATRRCGAIHVAELYWTNFNLITQ